MADETKEKLRRILEESETGAPAVGKTVRDRFATDEIYQRVAAYGDYEFMTGRRELVFSGVAGGFAISVTLLLYVQSYAAFDGEPLVSHLLYPLGFMYIILGGYQLYTENTLPPVVLVLERLASVPALGAIFGLVLLGNVVGAGFGTVLLYYGEVVDHDAAVTIGLTAVEEGWIQLFVKAIFAGLIVAGVVWMDFAAGDTISRLVIIYLAFLSIPLAGLYHVVVSSTELLYLVLAGEYGLWPGIYGFLLPVLLGNTLGGILLVTVVNYFQTTERRLKAVRDPTAVDPLSVRETLFGGLVGRSYLPPDAVDESESVETDGDGSNAEASSEEAQSDDGEHEDRELVDGENGR